jgi:putative PEP-CTERM system TPR-repeat lipoprotein
MSPARAGVLGVLVCSLALTGCGAFLTAHDLMERAQRDMKVGRWQDGAFELRALLHKQPRNAQAWLLLARLSLDAADPTGAQSALNHALKIGVKGPQVDLLRARTWVATGQPKALLDALAHGTLHLSEPDRTLMVARALLAMDRPDQALATVHPLLALHPALTEARVILAESLAQEGKLAQALEQLATAERLDPRSPEPPLLIGRIDLWLGRYPAAEQSLKVALGRMPPPEPLMHRVTALAALAESRLALGRVGAAARSQAVLAKLAPAAPATMLLDARIKLARKDLVGGTSELERVVQQAPNYMQARLVLGATLLKQGDFEQAQQQLEQVLQRAPDNLQARKLLAQVQLNLGQPGAALSVLTPALGAPNLDPQLISLFSAAARREGNSRALITALERSRREHPRNEAIAENLAAIYLNTGHAARALALLKKMPRDDNVERATLLIKAVWATSGAEAAGEEVDRLVAAYPRDSGVLDLAASYWATQDELQRSRTLLRQAFSANPDDVATTIGLARVEEAEGDASAAQHGLSVALASHPDVLALRLALADALVRTRAFGQARSILLAARKASTSPAVQFGLARVALAEGDLAQANGALDRAIAAQPARDSLVEAAGLLLMQAKQYAAALDRFTQAAHAEPDNALYWFERARAELALNQPDAARASLERAARLRPHWLPLVSALAVIDVRQGKGSAALSRVDALLASRPKDPGALALKGDVELAIGQPDAALATYAEAQRVRPSATVAIKLYSARLAAHVADPAQPLLDWLRRVPTDWRVRDVLGGYYMLVAHSLPQAVPEFRAVLRQVPNDIVALNNLAWILGRMGNPEAQSFAERAYHLAPQSAQVNDTLGWILASKGRYEKALAYVNRAMQLDPKDPDIAYHCAYVLAKTGQPARARQILSRILSSGRRFNSMRKAQRLLRGIGA